MEDLTTFAAENPASTGGRVCSICRLPDRVRAQIEASRNKFSPVPLSTISAWLEKHQGVKIQSHTIGGHFRKGHDKR